jgi:hypothetical protein
MKIFCKGNEKIWRNAKFILEDLAEGKKGDNIVVIADSVSYVNARALCDCAKELGMNSIIIDIDLYGGSERYMKFPVMEPLRAAILNSNITFMVTDQMKTDFGIFLGNTDECDIALMGVGKRFTLEANGMSEWDFDPKEVLNYRKRTLKLYDWLKVADTVHVTTKKGSDFTCKVGARPDGMYPVMTIIPFYAEIAIVPKIGDMSGVVVADGASEYAYSQRGFPIRPAFPGHQELYREPMKLVFDKGVLVKYSGDPEQTRRLETLLKTVVPAPTLCDEVGLVTTTSIENDMYGWQVDGTHQTHTVHVAIGNNFRRGEVIHAPEHVDFDMHDPVIEVDGQIIYKDRKFNDELIFRGK